MSRRKPLSRHWHVGDSCQYPIFLYRRSGRSATKWCDAEVVAVRGEKVVISSYGFESVHPCGELRVKPKPLGNALARVLNRFGLDRHRRTV